MITLGTKAANFDLPDVVSQKKVSLKDFDNKKALLVMFICSHCPYVKHVENEIAMLANDYQPKGVGFVAISSNDSNYTPDDAPKGLKDQAKRVGFNFPYLFDETQAVAKSYSASCTPDFFLFDKDTKLVYRGQLDSSRPENGVRVTGEDLRFALDAVLSNKLPNLDQKPSSGCNIKWKPGNQPDYY